jgi:hypothetical protein
MRYHTRNTIAVRIRLSNVVPHGNKDTGVISLSFNLASDALAKSRITCIPCTLRELEQLSEFQRRCPLSHELAHIPSCIEISTPCHNRSGWSGWVTHVKLCLTNHARRMQGENFETDEIISINDTFGNGCLLNAFGSNLCSC